MLLSSRALRSGLTPRHPSRRRVSAIARRCDDHRAMHVQRLEDRLALAAVPIVNPSFETEVLGDGGFTFAITGWSQIGSNGTFNPQPVHITPQATDGANVAFSSAGTLSQILTTNQAANTVYTLQVDLGERKDSAPAPSYSVELWAGGVQLATTNQLVTPQVNDAFVTVNLTYVSPAAGGALEIRLIAGTGSQGIWDNVRLDASTSAAQDDPTGPTLIPLQNATAILSQSGFNASNLIDANPTGTGWANSALVNNTAVVETVFDLNPSGATIPLTFTMFSGGFGQHTLGRFRISATSDDRTTFADGLQNGGDVTATWTVLTPLAVNSATAGVNFTVLGDNSILVSGTSPETDTYTIQTTSTLANITGFRLEAIEDPSFPSNGPGRASNGNYVVYNFTASIGAPTVTLQNTAAILSQGGFPASNLTDGNLGTGWANNALDDNTAVFETSANLNPAGQPMLLTFSIYSGGFGQHTLGRFRFSVTSDNRNTFADSLPNGGDVTATWTVLTPVSVTANRATLTVQGDGSVLASGAIDEFEVYQVTVLTTQANITGIRLETLVDPSLPSTGPGRAANGNFVVYDVRVQANTNVFVTNANATVPVAHVLANDLVAAGGAPIISAINTVGTQGAVAINPGAQTVSYDPTLSPALAALLPGEVLLDRFSYTLNVGGVMEPGTVAVVVLGVNDPPVANPDSYTTWTTDEDTTFNVVATAPVTPYVVSAAQAGNQAFGGSLGMDFNVNRTIVVTHLGVFDDGSNGLNLPLNARLWQRTGPATGVLLATIPFAPGATGTLVGGNRFLPLATPITLPAGFTGTIVAEGYGVGEQNGNSTTPPWTTNSGGGAVSFVGGGRFGTAGAFPATADGGPVNRYAAGTFRFVEPTLIANDTDPDAGQVVSAVAEVVLSSEGATVTINADGSFTYDPTTSASLQSLATGEFLADTFTYTATDGVGGTTNATANVTVNGLNDAPTFVSGAANQSVDEGQAFILANLLTFLDSEVTDSHSATIDWGDGTIEPGTITVVTPASPGVPLEATVSGGHSYDDNALVPFTVTITVLDAAGSPVVHSFDIAVNNVDPVATITGPGASPYSTAPGMSLDFVFAGSDQGPVDDANLTYDIDWGDGSPHGSAAGPAAHTYSTLGNFTITLTVTDPDGGIGTDTFDVSVEPVLQIGNDIVAGGLDGMSNRIIFSAASGGRVMVRWENSDSLSGNVPKVYGPFTPLPGGKLIAFGGDGDDTITVSNLTIPVEFHGGEGNDYLAGGTVDDSLFGDAGNDRLLGGYGNDLIDGGDDNDSVDAGYGDDVVFGGSGNDTLLGGVGHDVVSGGEGTDGITGSNGRDILLGGDGKDSLSGGNDEDVLAGGLTAYDTYSDPNFAALQALLAEWTSGNTYATRIANLKSGGGAAAGNMLDPGSNVTNDDGYNDILKGAAGNDWFLASTAVSGINKDTTDRVIASETLN